MSPSKSIWTNVNLINILTSLFALQPPDSSIPRGFIHLRSFCAVRGIGASLWLSFIRYRMFRVSDSLSYAGQQVPARFRIPHVWGPDVRGPGPRRGQLAPRCSRDCHWSAVPDFYLVLWRAAPGTEQRDEVNAFPTVIPLSIFFIASHAHIGDTASGKARAVCILGRDSALAKGDI